MFVHRCVGLVAALVLASSSALAIDFRLTIAFDKTNPATPLIGEAFAKHIQTASQGQMKVQVSGPETVPSFEQLQPVAAGVFDFGLTTGGYHAGTITAATVIDGLKADSLATLRNTGMIDEIEQALPAPGPQNRGGAVPRVERISDDHARAGDGKR